MASTSPSKRSCTTFDKIKGFATPKGSMFEVNLAALLFLRGLNSGLEFQLATNVKGAGALDDVVFRVAFPDGTSNTLFLQLKHRENPGSQEKPTGTVKKLLRDAKDKKTPVHTYYKSFTEIKNAIIADMPEDRRPFFLSDNIRDCMFALYTNAVTREFLGDDISYTSVNVAKCFPFLESASGKILSFDPNGSRDLDKDLLKCLSVEDSKNAEEFDHKNAQEFLGQFLVFSGQPSVGDFDKLIKFELEKASDTKARSVDANRLCRSFVEVVRDWWENSNEILHEESSILDSAIARIEVEDCSVRETGRYNLRKFSYTESAIAKFREEMAGKFTVLVIEPSEDSFRLSFTKFHNSTKLSHLLLSIECLLDSEASVFSELQSGRVKQIVLCAKDSNPESDSFSRLVEVCVEMEQCDAQMVLLATETETLFDKLHKRFPLSKRIKDTFNLSDFTKGSQNVILNKAFLHQNYETTFIKLLGNDPRNACYIDASSVVQMIDFEDGSLFAPDLAENISYFVDRTLDKANVVKESYFQLHPVPGNGIVVNSSMQHVHSILLQGDSSVERQIRDTLQKFAQSCIFPGGQGSEPPFIGEHFVLGRFKCNFVCVRRTRALQMRSIADGIFSNLFVIEQTHQDDVLQLSKINDSHHFFSMEADVLYWVKSVGPMWGIQEHIDRTIGTSSCSDLVHGSDERLETGSSSVIVKFMTNRRVEIVCGEPGMGKSTLMTYLALEAKKCFPDSWVIFISLNDHTNLFDDRQLFNDAPNYLLAAAFSSEIGLQKTLFEIALRETGNVVIILDGYDEIAPRYISECHSLLKRLCNTKAKHIWITSRNSMKSNLEEFLMTLSAKLREFSEDDQRTFLKLYWKSAREKAKAAGTNILSEEELECFITSLLARTTQAISDQRNEFMSIPLQAQMVAEVFEDHVIAESQEHFNTNEKWDVLHLLHRFVEKKLHVYLQSRLHVNPTDTNYSSHIKPHKRDFKINHSYAALVLILGEEDVAHLHCSLISDKSKKFLQSIIDGRDKTGFIDRVVNGKPRFIHRVYAEYFVAKWFENNYAQNEKFLQKHQYSENFKVIREIFDLLLSRKCQSKLHFAVLKANAAQVKELLQNGANADERDSGGRTALHLAATLQSSIRNSYENINFRHAEEIIKDLVAHTKDFDLKVKVFKGSPLLYARVTRSWHVMDTLLRHDPDTTCLGKDFWDLGNKDMLQAICMKDLDSLLQSCLDKGLSVDHCFEYTSKSDTKTVQTLLLTACLLGSVKVARVLIKSGANRKAVNEKGATSLHLAARSGNSELVQLLIKEVCQHNQSLAGDADNRKGGNSLHEAPEKSVDKIQGADFIAAADNDGNTALHIWAGNLRHAAAKNRPPNEILNIVKLFVDSGANLEQENVLKQTPLMLAATNCHSNIVEYMLKNVDIERKRPKSQRAPEENKDDDLEKRDAKLNYINKRDVNGLSALHHAVVKKRSPDIVPFLIKHGGDVRNVDEKGRTTLISAILQRSGPEVVEELLKAVGADSPRFVNTCDKEGNNAIHHSITTDQSDIFALLVKAGGNIFQKNANGQCPLRLAVNCRLEKVVEYILTNFEEMCAGLEEAATCPIYERLTSKKAAYINTRDKRGDTVLMDAVLRGTKDIASRLISHGADARVVNADGLTPLHMVLKTGRFLDDVVRVLLDAVGEDSRAQYVNTRGHDGSTALHETARLDTVVILVNAGGDLTIPDGDGHTPFMLAVMNGDAEIVAYMLKSLANDAKSGYMQARNNEGLAVLHLAAYNGTVEVMKRLLAEDDADIWSVDDGFCGTSLHWAVKTNCEVIRVLLAACGSGKCQEYLDFGDSSGDTALHWAVEEENRDSVQVLIEAGANVNLESTAGITPLAAASENDNKDIFYFFCSLGYF